MVCGMSVTAQSATEELEQSARTGEAGAPDSGPDSLRPQADDGARADAAAVCRAPGRIAEVIYAGALTRFLVDLDAGVRLTATAPNLDDSAVALQRGARVTLTWRRDDVMSLSTA